MRLQGWGLPRLTACLAAVGCAAAKAAEKPLPDTSILPLVVGAGILALLISFIQLCHWREQAKTFTNSPLLAQALEDEYLANCTRGLQGYQTGEMTDEKKAVVRAAFLEQLREDPACPLSRPYWSNTLLPSLFYRWPAMLVKRLIWGAEVDPEAEERAQEAEEDRQAAEEERKEQEEKARWAAEKEERKAKNAAHLAEKKRLEEEKRRKWAEEAEQEEEEERAAKAEKQKGSKDDDCDELIVTGKVTSVDELKKKGHYLIEVAFGSETVQLVITSAAEVGQEATVALEGATLANGSQAKRSKVAGEWSEGVLLKLGKGTGKPAAAAAAEEPEALAEAAEEKQEDASAGGDGKARQRKSKKKG